MPPPPPHREMPPPASASASASAIATRIATHWTVDDLAGDESFGFSVLQALLGAWSDPLAGAPKATRERLALRSLQELSSLIPARDDAAATPGVVRVDGARSCEDVLSLVISEVEISGKLEKDLLTPFSQDIQEIICTKKLALPETSFQLLKGVDPWITSMTPQSQLEHNGTSVLHQPCTPKSGSYVPPQEFTMDAVGLGARSPERRPIVERDISGGSVLNSDGCDAPLPTDASEPGHFAEGITAQDLNLQSASVLLPISCNGANQGSKLETNLQPGTAAEDRMAFEEQKGDTSCLEVSDQALHDDGSIMKNDTAHGGLTEQTAPVSQNYNVTLHDKTSEANCFSEQKSEKDGTDVQKDNCCTSISSSSKDRDRESAKKTSNEEKSQDTSPEVRSKDQDISDSLEGLSQQNFCTKCGKDGQLLTCSDCLLAVHDSCLGSSVAFEGTNLFYCPVCRCEKARKAYEEAKKKYFETKMGVAAYLGTAQVSKEHDEQLNGVQPGAAKRNGDLNGSDMSKRNSIDQNEAYDLAHQDEEPHQPRKKQKINAGNGYPKEVLTEKDPIPTSGPASMDKHSALQNNSKTRVKDPEKRQQAGDNEAHKEAGNERQETTIASSQRGHDTSLNQDDEVDQEDSCTASNQSCGKRSIPPWHNMRESKKRLHEKESAVPRKRRSVHSRKRSSNRVALNGRRDKLMWTEAEEAMLRDAMAKFTPQDGGQISWIHILQYGRHVFDEKRQPPDLRVKWRNMNMKTTTNAGR